MMWRVVRRCVYIIGFSSIGLTSWQIPQDGGEEGKVGSARRSSVMDDVRVGKADILRMRNIATKHKKIVKLNMTKTNG